MNKLINKKKIYQIFLSKILIFTLLFTTGCIPKSAVKKISDFSDAMSIVMQGTTKSFERVEETHLTREKAKLVNQYSKDKTVVRNFNVKPFFPENIWEGRMLVINGLKTYAGNLKAVVGNEKLSEFDGSTKALGNKLLEVNEQFVSANVLRNKPVSPDRLKLFALAVNRIGYWFVNYKREKVTKQVLREMDSAVRDVCNLLAQDLGEKPYKENLQLDSNVQGLRSKLWQDYTLIINERILFLDQCDGIPPFAAGEPAERTKLRGQCNNYFISPTERKNEIEYIANLSIERKKSDDLMAAVKEGLETIPQAHSELEKAFDEKNVSLDGLISVLFDEAEQIKTFYNSLGKKE